MEVSLNFHLVSCGHIVILFYFLWWFHLGIFLLIFKNFLSHYGLFIAWLDFKCIHVFLLIYLFVCDICPPTFLCVCISVCVCIHAYMFASVGACGSQRLMLSCFPESLLHFILWHRVSQQTWSSLLWRNWCQRYTGMHLAPHSSWDYRWIASEKFLCVYWRSEFGFSG